jgi:hypothetical protein
MAEKEVKLENGKQVALTVLDVAWIVQSAGTQRNVLIRSRNKEIQGGEVWALRGREIDALNALILKFS